VASDTRQRLIRTTGRLLRRQGYGAMGLSQVISEAGAPKGSLYFHFPGGKEELAAAAVDRFADRTTATIADWLREEGSAADAVVRMFDFYIEHLPATGFAEGCAVATVALDAAASHDVLAQATERAFGRWTGLLAEALEAEGRRPDEARNLATLAIAAVEGAIVMAKGQRSAEPLAGTRDALRAILA
jgi:TetR/AcrR family transcriptional repressor of lmrAB and yxaGH operons